MTTQTQRIDAIEAAILSLSQSVSAIANMLSAQTSTPQTATPATPRTSKATKNARHTARTQTTKNDQSAPKFPKANAGTITGTVVRHAGGPRAGYGMLVATTSGEVWVNCVKAGGRPALFLNIPVGATVSYDVNDAGYVAGSEPIAPVGQQQTLPANTPKRRKAASQTMPTTTTVAALMTAPAPTLAPVTPSVPVLGRVGKGCLMCAGNHGNEGSQKRELECLERIYFQQTTKVAGGIFDDAFTSWARSFQSVRPQTTDAAATVVPAASGVSTPVAPVATPASVVAPAASVAPNVVPTITDGEHTVTLVGFPKTKTGMVKVHNATTFAGKDGNGRWLTNLSATLYTKATHFTANDKLVVTIKGGVPTRIKRIAKIEADTGMVEGVKASGKNEAPVQVTRTKKDDTKTEAQRAARRAKLVSQTR